jgi:DNA invertase Pin-like site-specific DNA recombinase
VQRVLELAANRSIDAVVVTKADRISRSLRDMLNLGAELDGYGVALVTADEQIDTSTPLGKAMSQMRGVFAELERGMAASRTSEGMRAAKAKGVRLGRPPVGWRVEKGEWRADHRHELVKRAHRKRQNGLTLLEIARAFNDEGIDTGSGSGMWHPTSISRLLRSPASNPGS